MTISRQDPFVSPVGCLGGLVLMVGIGVAVLVSGGAIFSPGVLTASAENRTPLKGFASHADFEDDCRQCHVPLHGIAPERCENCHGDVAVERVKGIGLHGKLPPEEAARCAVCHLDHLGRDLNPSATALKKFDHGLTGFSLARHITNYDGTALECKACHTGSDFTLDAAACSACHAAHDAAFMTQHLTAFGDNCLACHDGSDRTADFDHARTDFALEGKHGALECVDCHQAQVAAQDTPTQCAACHAEPDSHAGVFSAGCEACHTSAAWTPAHLEDKAAFDHADTGFQLSHHTQDYDGTPFTCRTCHTGEKFAFAAQTCTDCHTAHDVTFITRHIQAYGPNCLSCHDGAGNMQNFDHSRFFVLDGGHAALECSACHVDQQFKGTSKECAACHREPEIHAGLFGGDCAACHTATAWAPAQLTRHTFPLDHGDQGEVACATCHPNSYVAYTCYGCHAHDPANTERKHSELDVALERLNECAKCHATGRRKEGGG